MKLKFLSVTMFAAVMALAAMGPGRSDAPPESTVPPVRPTEPATGAAWPTSRAPESGTPPAAAGQPAAVGEAGLHILSATESDPATLMWQARPLVIFADTGADPAFLEQMRRLERDPTPLIARDVVVITDTDPATNSVWRQQLHPRGFSLVLLDKDGQVKQRKPSPWTVREISRAIDKFPLRRQELGRAGVLP